MSVYIRRVSATERWVVQPVLYKGSDPQWPLWQVDIFTRSKQYTQRSTNTAGAGTTVTVASDLFVAADVGKFIKFVTSGNVYVVTARTDLRNVTVLPTLAVADQSGQAFDLYPQHFSDVWQFAGSFCTQFLNSTNTADWCQVWARDGWTESGAGWANSSSSRGSDDSLWGVPANLFRENSTQNSYATKTFTVPATWAGGTLAIMVAWLTNVNYITDKTEYALYEGSGITGKRIALNGRGSFKWDAINGTVRALDGVRPWNTNHLSTAASSPTSPTCNTIVELARGLTPGTTYTLQIARRGTSGTHLTTIGRGMLLRESNVQPSDSGAKLWFPEFHYLYDGSTVQQLPGTFSMGWTGTNDFHTGCGDGNTGGPIHGMVWQTGDTWSADGVTLDLDAAADGSWHGPYSSCAVTFNDTHCQTESGLTTGVGGAITQGSAVVDLSADAPDLSAYTSGGYLLYVDGRTDGIDGGRYYHITAADNTAKTVTVSPTPTGTSGGSLAWRIGHRLAQTIAKVRTYSGRKCRVHATYTSLFTHTAIIFVGSYSPNTSTARPQKTASLYPYDAVNVLVWDTVTGEPTMFAHQQHTADLTGILPVRRAWTFDNIEGSSLRNVGRMYVIDTPYSEWTNVNIAAAANTAKATFATASGYKAYYYARTSTGQTGVEFAKDAVVVLWYDTYFCESDYFTPVTSGGSGGLGIGI